MNILREFFDRVKEANDRGKKRSSWVTLQCWRIDRWHLGMPPNL